MSDDYSPIEEKLKHFKKLSEDTDTEYKKGINRFHSGICLIFSKDPNFNICAEHDCVYISTNLKIMELEDSFILELCSYGFYLDKESSWDTLYLHCYV